MCPIEFLKHDKNYANPILQCVFYMTTLKLFKLHLIACLTDAFGAQHPLHLISSLQHWERATAEVLSAVLIPADFTTLSEIFLSLY